MLRVATKVLTTMFVAETLARELPQRAVTTTRPLRPGETTP